MLYLNVNATDKKNQTETASSSDVTSAFHLAGVASNPG
jgi:hypothetical protein